MSHGHTILLVEDERTSAMMFTFLLKQNGYQVCGAQHGVEAVSVFAEHPEVDLVLMDLNLGHGIDGTEAARLILKQREVPIVFLSSHTEGAFVNKTREVSSYGYVVKSSGTTVLLAAIDTAYRLFEARQSLQARDDSLVESERKFRTLFEEAVDAIFIADVRTGEIIDCNPAAENLVGRSRKELIGNEQRILHPRTDVDPTTGLSASFARHAATAHANTIQTQIITKRGDLVPVWIRAKRIEIGGRQVMQGIFRPIDSSAERLRLDALLDTLTLALSAARGIDRAKELDLDCPAITVGSRTAAHIAAVIHALLALHHGGSLMQIAVATDAAAETLTIRAFIPRNCAEGLPSLAALVAHCGGTVQTHSETPTTLVICIPVR